MKSATGEGEVLSKLLFFSPEVVGFREGGHMRFAWLLKGCDIVMPVVLIRFLTVSKKCLLWVKQIRAWLAQELQEGWRIRLKAGLPGATTKSKPQMWSYGISHPSFRWNHNDLPLSHFCSMTLRHGHRFLLLERQIWHRCILIGRTYVR